jgi:hypothetical protein
VNPVAKILLLILALGLLAGCSSLTVNYDYDTNVDWSKHKTWAWMGKQGGPAAGQSPELDSGLLDQRIRSSVEYEMEARGMTPSDEPDVFVIYHLGSEEKIQVTDWGYRYSDYYWGYGGRQIDVHQYTEGMLVIDIVDAETTNLVWRGIGQKVIDRTQKSPDEVQANLDKIVNKIMASYPPVK